MDIVLNTAVDTRVSHSCKTIFILSFSLPPFLSLSVPFRCFFSSIFLSLCFHMFCYCVNWINFQFIPPFGSPRYFVLCLSPVSFLHYTRLWSLIVTCAIVYRFLRNEWRRWQYKLLLFVVCSTYVRQRRHTIVVIRHNLLTVTLKHCACKFQRKKRKKRNKRNVKDATFYDISAQTRVTIRQND